MTKKMIFEPEDAPAIATRFWDKVNKSDGCWLWTGAKHPTGYGTAVVYRSNRPAHRVAYALEHGPHALEDGLVICHSCDVRLCVRPSHLWQGTHAENQADCRQKGRRAKGNAYPNAKLNPDAVRYIRLVATDSAGIAHCMVKFSIHPQTIKLVVERKTWGYVTD